jgi:hypothetical protein
VVVVFLVTAAALGIRARCVSFGTLVVFIDLVDHVACGEDFETAEDDHDGGRGLKTGRGQVG